MKEKEKVFISILDEMDLYTEGKDMQDAIEMARDIISLHVVDLEDDKLEIPSASSYERAYEIAKENADDICDFSTGIVTFVDVDTTDYRRKINMKVVRKNVCLPNWLNYEADKAGINVSKVLQDALINVLGLKQKY